MELELQKSENFKAPTTAMKSMVDKLRKQLDDKEAKMKVSHNYIHQSSRSEEIQSLLYDDDRHRLSM